MSITTDLTPEQEARLSEKAALQGKDVADFAREVVLREAEPDEWLTLLYSMGVETGVSLSNEAVSGGSLYEDHL
jgi:hypothetical protein